MAHQRNLLTDLVDGAVGGAVATWVMGKVTTALYERENDRTREREDQARHGKTAYDVAAEKAAKVVGAELTDEDREKYASAIHWALGVTVGALYGALRPRTERAALARGLAFGTAVWLVMDETVTPALGLTPGPAAFPWQTHARGLLGHLAFGAAADATLAAIQPAA